MILKTLLSTFLLALFVIPAEGGRSGIVPTVDDSNRVSYQQSGYYLPSIEAKYKLPKKTGESLGLSVTADSVIIIDDNSGQVLWQKNPGRIHSLASLTKLMTAYLFLQQDYDFDQVVEITQTEKSDPEESTLTVSKGEQVTVYDLFFSSLVGSANNATRELISSLEKSEAEFVEIMNQKAAELGMANTHFVDVTGIGKGNTSTVADYIKLVRL
ncbi:serine hydrolase, partial [Patescibacteria group bacterium]|nr:serine hydrolase [Patescibacteria group bacterium]